MSNKKNTPKLIIAETYQNFKKSQSAELNISGERYQKFKNTRQIMAKLSSVGKSKGDIRSDIKRFGLDSDTDRSQLEINEAANEHIAFIGPREKDAPFDFQEWQRREAAIEAENDIKSRKRKSLLSKMTTEGSNDTQRRKRRGKYYWMIDQEEIPFPEDIDTLKEIRKYKGSSEDYYKLKRETIEKYQLEELGIESDYKVEKVDDAFIGPMPAGGTSTVAMTQDEYEANTKRSEDRIADNIDGGTSSPYQPAQNTHAESIAERKYCNKKRNRNKMRCR